MKKYSILWPAFLGLQITYKNFNILHVLKGWGITEETAEWTWAVPVVLVFNCGMGLDWDFAVGSEDVSFGSFSGILPFYMEAAL